MRRSFALGLVALIPVLSIACEIEQPAPGELDQEPVDQDQEAIFGGTADTTHKAVVWLLEQDSGFSCTGTVIAKNGTTGFVLTAAHCKGDSGNAALDEIDFAIVANDYQSCLTDPPGAGCEAIFPVVAGSQIFHPSYNFADQGSPYDFSLLRISSASSAQVIPAAAPSDGLSVGSSIEQVGYGRTETNMNNSVRRHVTVTVDQLDSVNIAHDQQDGKGTCNGDSGGPSLSNGTVVGVTSYGDLGCLTAGVSGRVQAVYNTFIAPFINAPVTETCETCFDEEVNQPSGGCASVVDACFAAQPCADLANCLADCTTNACVDDCADAHQAGIDDYLAIFDCGYCDQCASLCSSECADLSASGSAGVGTGASVGSGSGSGGASGAGGAGGVTAGNGATSGGDGDDGGGETTLECDCRAAGAPTSRGGAAFGLAGLALAIAGLARRRR